MKRRKRSRFLWSSLRIYGLNCKIEKKVKNDRKEGGSSLRKKMEIDHKGERERGNAIYIFNSLTLSLLIPVEFDADKDLSDLRSCERQHVDVFAFVKRYHTEDFHSTDSSSSDCYLYYSNYSLALLARQY
mgnify:CR=1 FL=1